MDCDKLWRFQRLNKYDAWDLENATNTQLIALPPWPVAAGSSGTGIMRHITPLPVWVTLKKSMKEGDMMSEEEILKLQQNTQQAIAKPSRRWMKNRKKQNSK